MSFLNPFFLFALIAVGLPLLIHLLNLKKPQRIIFSTLTFFQELKDTTIRRIQIKKYILLILRLLAIACLALVLARPFLPPGMVGPQTSQAPALNAILLDNSVSMSRIGKKGPLFEQAKEVIQDIQSVAKDDDRFMLQVTNGEAGFQNILSSANLSRSLRDVQMTPAGNYLGERLTGMIDFLKEAPYENKNIFIITDGQWSQIEPMSTMDDQQISLSVIDLGAVKAQNTVVERIASSTNMIGANIPFDINVEVANLSDIAAVNQFVTLEFEGQNAGQYQVDLEPDSRKTYSFQVSPSKTGSLKGRVLIEGDEFQPDNTFYFTVQVPETRKVLWIRERSNGSDFISYSGAMLRVAGDNDAQLDYKEATPDILNSPDLSSYDALILDGLERLPEYSYQPLVNFVQNGGGLVFFPSEQGDIVNYNQWLASFNAGRFAGPQGDYASFESIASADQLLDDHPAFNGLFERDENEELRFSKPEIYYYLKFIPQSSGTAFDLMQLNNGDRLLWEKRVGEGHLLIASIGNDPGWSNFPIKPLFAPFYYRLLLYASSSDQGGFASHQLGSPFNWRGTVDAENVVIEANGDQIKPATQVVSSGIALSYPAEEWSPGYIKVQDGDHSYVLAANMEKGESDFKETGGAQLSSLTDKEAIVWIPTEEMSEEDLKSEILTSGFGKEIWNWFMLAGLLFLIAETMVSIWYKAEKVS